MSEQKNTSRDNHLRTQALVEGAVMVALATALSYIKLFELPQGGSICIGMLPIFLYCYRWGFSKGMLCSFAYGLLQLLLDGAYAWGWQSMILDYLLAFAVLGVAGLFAGKKGGLYVGTVVGSLCRFLCHFVAGFTIWRIYAPTELFNYTFTNPYFYSAVYNGSFVAIDMVLCIVIFALLSKPMEKYFTGADIRS